MSRGKPEIRSEKAREGGAGRREEALRRVALGAREREREWARGEGGEPHHGQQHPAHDLPAPSRDPIRPGPARPDTDTQPRVSGDFVSSAGTRCP